MIHGFLFFLLSIFATCQYAAQGNFFNVVSSASQSSNSTTLNITTTVPNHVYPKASLQVSSACTIGANTCSNQVNNTCLFSVSNSQALSLALECPQGQSNTDITLCLNGTAHLSCQSFSTSISPQLVVAAQIGPNTTASAQQTAVYLGNGTFWDSPNIISGTTNYTVNTVWCTPSKSLCVLGGYKNSNNNGFVYTSTDGGTTWTAISSANFVSRQIYSIDCSEDGDLCYASGINPSNFAPVILKGSAQASEWTVVNLPSSQRGYLNSIACSPDASQCLAVGYYQTTPIAFALDSNGWQLNNPQTYAQGAGTVLYTVACSSSLSQCVASGYYATNTSTRPPYDSQAIFYTYTDNTWSTAITAAPVTSNTLTSSRIVSLSCDVTGMLCTGVGQSSTNGNVSTAFQASQTLIYTTRNGGASWTGPLSLAGIGSSTQNVLQSVACTSDGLICTTIGRGNQLNGAGANYSTPFSYTSTNAGQTWGNIIQMPFAAGNISSDPRTIGGAQ